MSESRPGEGPPEKLVYVANARLPSRKAHTYQIVQMCQAFTEVGTEVELVVPRRRAPETAPDSSPEAYYDVPMDFECTTLPCLDVISTVDELPAPASRLAFYLQAVTFALAAWVYVLLRGRDATLLYSRSLTFATLAASLLGDRTVLEVHHVQNRGWVMRLLGRVTDRLRGLVVITEGLAEEWAEVTDTRIVVEPDGVRLDRFETDASKTTLREDLALPRDVPVVCYTGSLKRWKGVETLVEAAGKLPPDTVVCVVGGDDDQRGRVREAVGTVPDQVHFVDHVPPDDVPRYLLASDVLVLPNTAESVVSTRHTSPLKLFEYMAAQRPIVASNIPSLREVLDEETAYLFEPDCPTSLARAITTALEDEQRAVAIAEAARGRVADYAWRRRAKRILAAFGEAA